MTRARRFAVPSVTLLGLLLLFPAFPALADDADMAAREAQYSAYHRAIAAHERCRKTHLDEEAHAAVARYIERQGASRIGTKRLMLIQQAKKDIRAAGCDSALAQEALARFDAELQPQIP